MGHSPGESSSSDCRYEDTSTVRCWKNQIQRWPLQVLAPEGLACLAAARHPEI